MFQITLDIFSGRENPSIRIEDQEARDLGLEISRNRDILMNLDAGFQGLGFRGLLVEAVDDGAARRYDLPSTFRIAGSSGNSAKSEEIAERLIRRVLKEEPRDGKAYSEDFEKTVLGMLTSIPTSDYSTQEDRHGSAPSAAAELSAASCTIEVGAFNPGFWNDPSFILRNNCYNYASNKRTNTFAQPGRGCGHMYENLFCPEMVRASLCDGLHHRFDCFPDTEAPRWLTALVIAPGFDFHWYRRQLEGFWGHKPGGTAARNFDNSGNVIFNPETADRGPYVHFCGYFYVPRSQKIF
jgi:hypothetical protein